MLDTEYSKELTTQRKKARTDVQSWPTMRGTGTKKKLGLGNGFVIFCDFIAILSPEEMKYSGWPINSSVCCSVFSLNPPSILEVYLG